jgi:putative oxidoreductase
MGHAFWQVVGTPLFPIQLVNCSKNVCMAGGLLFIMATRNQPALLPRPAHADWHPTMPMDEYGEN